MPYLLQSYFLWHTLLIFQSLFKSHITNLESICHSLRVCINLQSCCKKICHNWTTTTSNKKGGPLVLKKINWISPLFGWFDTLHYDKAIYIFAKLWGTDGYPLMKWDQMTEIQKFHNYILTICLNRRWKIIDEFAKMFLRNICIGNFNLKGVEIMFHLSQIIHLHYK